MLDAPKTLEEARQYKYGKWAGNPGGFSYYEGDCAYAVLSDYVLHQCSRKNGHGPDGLYCKQHAKMVESND